MGGRGSRRGDARALRGAGNSAMQRPDPEKEIMRWTSFILGCALALAPCLPAPALAAPAAPSADAPTRAASAPRSVRARPALWVVRDEDTTIYLFGTIHLLKPGMRWFEGPMRAAFDKSGEVVLEIAGQDDEPEAQQMLLRRAFDPGGESLSSRLPAPSREKLQAALAANDLPLEIFDHVKPWFTTLTLTVAPLHRLGYDPQSGADRVIEAAATQAGKTLTGLETAAEQIGIFETLPDPLQVDLLVQTLDELPTLAQTIERMIDAWAKGKPDELAAIMNESVDSNPELEKRLLTDRNARWADWISTRMEKPGTVFIAVGAGHLAGDGSVQQMLKARGISARRVSRRR